MRTIPSRLALLVVLALAAPALVVHGQRNPEAMPQAGLVRLLDEDQVAFGVTVDSRADVWRLDPPNGNLLPWLLIESPLGVANVREIARQLSERNIGAVLFAGSETGGDMLNTHGGSLEAVAQAIDTVLAAGKEFGLPVAMTSTTNMMERIEQGARLFTGGVTPALRREAGR